MDPKDQQPASATIDPTASEGAGEELWGELARRVEALRRAELFRDSPPSLLAHVATALVPVTVKAGMQIVRQGEVAEDFYLVESGTLVVQMEVGGRTHEIALVGPGEFFGEVALVSEDCRMATVRTLTDARLWTLSAAAFRELMQRRPELEAHVRAAASQRQVAARQTVFELEERNLAALASMSGTVRIGSSPDNEVVLDSRLVSEHHAVVERAGDGYTITHTATGSQTLVNGAPVTTAALRDGDEIRVGDQRLVFDRRELVHVLERRGMRIDAVGLVQEIKGGRRLLQDLSLSILPGEFVAIVGGSGAGKTTLMDALSGLRPATGGTVLYNGVDYYADVASFRHVLGYVPQDDIIQRELPLRQTVRFAAELRLPPHTSKQEVDRIVDATLEDLDLTQRADVKVSALSGGQRKRASIAVELLTRPRVFYLDEPTSGLDPATEGQMMRLMRRMADEGSTVVLTTHATANVMLCDKVVFLARDGHLTFFGSPARALRYFGAESFDEIYELLADEATTPAQWQERFLASEDHALQHETAARSTSAPGPGTGRGGLRGALRQLRLTTHQLGVLGRRDLATHLRDPGQLPQVAMPPVVFTVLLLILFPANLFDPATPNPSAPMQLLFTFSFMAFLFGLLFGVQAIVKEFPVFFRERMVGVKILPYVLSKMSFLGPSLLVSISGMTLVLWLTDRLPDGGVGVYGPLLLTLYLTAFAGLTLSLFTSAIVNNSQQATDMVTPWIAPQVLFAGALFAVPAMNAAGRFVSAIASVRWAFEGTASITELNDLFALSPSPIGQALLLQYESSFARDPLQVWVILAAFVVVPLLATLLVLSRRRQPR
jgi:ABC transport system ATP-binding/permease protein